MRTTDAPGLGVRATGYGSLNVLTRNTAIWPRITALPGQYRSGAPGSRR